MSPLRQLIVVLLLLAAGIALAAPQRHEIVLYVRDGCPHCEPAEAFLATFAGDRPWLRIVYRSVDDDPSAGDDLVRHSRDAGVWPPGVPTFVFDGRVVVGFDSPERTGAELAALVEGRSQNPETVETELFGALSDPTGRSRRRAGPGARGRRRVLSPLSRGPARERSDR